MEIVLSVGIDTSLGNPVVCAMAADGRMVARTTVVNDRDGGSNWSPGLGPRPRRTRGWPWALRPRRCTMRR